MSDQKEILEKFEEVAVKLQKAVKSVDLEGKKVEIEKLKVETENPDFWNNPEIAAKTSQKLAALEKNLEEWQGILGEFEENAELLSALSDAEIVEWIGGVEDLISRGEKLLVQTYLNGPYDSNSCVLSIICGTGGKDAQDFTDMLARMYARYFESKGWKLTLLDKTPAEEVGLKNISYLVEGHMAYGYLKGEHGVHRLVRQSPFNSGNTRETSFAMVDVIPQLELDQQVEIAPDDLRIDVFRASGAGGQHVNTTDSAVRITHLPTGLVVSSQNERSQHQNKETAMKMLQGKLVALMVERNLAKVEDLRGVKTEMSWGHQIRSYVLHPYKMVKDHRTDYESGNPDAVLNGDLDGFVEAGLGS